LPYALLALLAALTLPLHQTRGTAATYAGVALCVAAALWMLFMYALRPPPARHMLLFVAGLVAMTTALILIDSWFGFFVTACFAYSRELRCPWQLAGAAAAAVLAALSQTAGVKTSLPVHLLILVFAIALDLLLLCSLMWLLWVRDEQIAQHQRAMDELSAANRRLEATIAENETLHE